MWPSTSPGNARLPPVSSAGALFDSAAAPSPTTAIFPPEMPMSTSRPSARRQLARNASTSVIQASRPFYHRSMPHGMHRHRRHRVGDIEDALYPQQRLAMAVE